MMIFIISYITYFIYPSYVNSWVSCMCVHSLRTWTTYQSKFWLKKYWTFFWMKQNFHWIQRIQRILGEVLGVMEAWIDVPFKDPVCYLCRLYSQAAGSNNLFLQKVKPSRYTSFDRSSVLSHAVSSMLNPGQAPPMFVCG